MSFFYGQKKLKNKKRQTLLSLLMQKTPENNRKRAFMSASDKGSITVEAAIVIPLFLLTVISLMKFIVTIQFQNNLYTVLFDTANEIGKEAYIYGEEELSGILTESRIISKMYKGNVREYINHSVVKNGMAGMDFSGTNMDYEKEDGIFVRAGYQIEFGGLIGAKGKMTFSQGIFFRPWTGKTIVDAANTTQIVYITEKGTVYHTNRDCTHLRLSKSKATYGEIGDKRNQNGARYKPCELCAEAELQKESTVYITKEGNRYHISEKCSGLKRTIYEIPMEKAGDKKLCARCRK